MANSKREIEQKFCLKELLKLNRNTLIFLVVQLFFICSSSILSQQNNHEVLIEDITVNNKEAIIFNNRVIISDNDSIVFEYKLNPKIPEEPFLFRAILTNGKDTSIKVLNNPVIRFANLPESDYTFEISAFSENGNWISRKDAIEFEVDNVKKDLLISNRLLEQKNENLARKLDKYEKEKGWISQTSDIMFILLLALVIVLIIIYIYTYYTKRKNKLIGKNGGIKLDNIKKLEADNFRIRKEIRALRKQIDYLQDRSKLLLSQNKELQEKINSAENMHNDLENLQKQKEEMFAIVVHDIKNPASVIKGLVELLSNYDSNAEDAKEIMKDIIATSSKILSLSDEISKIMSLEGTKMELSYQTVNFNDIANDIFMRNKFKAKEKNMTYEHLFAEDLPQVTLDINKIDEAMDNLVSNAIKYTKNNGSILLETSYNEDRNHVVFSVSDTGLGLSEEDIKNAFQKGSKLSAKPTANESSTGLGLWIVKKMVEAHNGNVWLKSKKGEGSTFSFSIPLKPTVTSKTLKGEVEN